jgi:hypothetical protein
MQTQIARQTAFKPAVAGNRPVKATRARVVSVQVRRHASNFAVIVRSASAHSNLQSILKRNGRFLLYVGGEGGREPEGQRRVLQASVLLSVVGVGG